VGATGFAILCGLGIGLAGRRLAAGFDTAIAMVWALGMALGILFISLAPGYAPDLMSYLFGSILFVPPAYLLFLLGLDAVILMGTLAVFKELQAVAFDEEYATVVGVPSRVFQFLLLILISLAVVALIRVVGVILVIALLTIPAAVARQWSDRLSRMMVGAALLGMAACTGGLFLSAGLATAYDTNLPTGPVIILLAAVLYGVSSVLRRGRR
jgi:zinc transport system permease protein